MLNKTPDTEKKYSGVLSIKDLAIDINLGVPEEERAKKQRVFLTVNIDCNYSDSDLGADDYNKVKCYDSIICEIYNKLEGKEFHLIESLNLFILQILEKGFTGDAKISLRILKRPIIKGIERSIEFELKNF